MKRKQKEKSTGGGSNAAPVSVAPVARSVPEDMTPEEFVEAPKEATTPKEIIAEEVKEEEIKRPCDICGAAPMDKESYRNHMACHGQTVI